jgi:hypothetical protein
MTLETLEAIEGQPYLLIAPELKRRIFSLARKALEQEARLKRGPEGVTLCMRCFHPAHDHTDGCPTEESHWMRKLREEQGPTADTDPAGLTYANAPTYAAEAERRRVAKLELEAEAFHALKDAWHGPGSVEDWLEFCQDFDWDTALDAATRAELGGCP